MRCRLRPVDPEVVPVNPARYRGTPLKRAQVSRKPAVSSRRVTVRHIKQRLRACGTVATNPERGTICPNPAAPHAVMRDPALLATGVEEFKVHSHITIPSAASFLEVGVPRCASVKRHSLIIPNLLSHSQATTFACCASSSSRQYMRYSDDPTQVCIASRCPPKPWP